MSFLPGSVTALRQCCKLAKRIYRTSEGMKEKLKKRTENEKEENINLKRGEAESSIAR
jgi:hypothetical protein